MQVIFWNACPVTDDKACVVASCQTGCCNYEIIGGVLHNFLFEIVAECFRFNSLTVLCELPDSLVAYVLRIFPPVYTLLCKEVLESFSVRELESIWKSH